MNEDYDPDCQDCYEVTHDEMSDEECCYFHTYGDDFTEWEEYNSDPISCDEGES